MAEAVQATVAPLSRPLSDRLVDLHVYITAVSSFVHGQSLYGLHGSLRAGFTYPPFAGVVLLPLAAVPEPASRVLWTGLTVVATAGIALVVVRALPRRVGPDALVWPAFTALLLASKPLQSNLAFGQISVFLTLAVLADVIALDGSRWQGALTGLAAAIKLTPLLFVPYLWLIGRRRAALVAAGCFGACSAIGLAALPHDTASFWGTYVWHESQGLPLAEGGNQSIYGVLLRAGAHGATLAVLWVGLSAAVAVVGLWAARRALVDGRRLLGVAAVGCVSILVSPISWTHHQTWILVAAAGLLTLSATFDLPIGALLVLPMLVGLPGIDHAGPVGRWLAANNRSVLAAAVIILSLRRGAGSPEPRPVRRRRTAGTRPDPSSGHPAGRAR